MSKEIQRIGIIGDNSIEYLQIINDIWSSQKSVVLIDWRMPFDKINDNLTAANVKECYVDFKIYSEIDINKYNENMKINCINKIYKKEAREVPKEIYDKFCENYSDDEAIVFFSSGTTGKSKGIILSHKAINLNADAVIKYLKVTNKDVIYIAKTLAHSSTMVCELLVGLKLKARLIIAPTVVTTRFTFNNIENYHATLIAVNPTLLVLYLDSLKEFERARAFESIRVISCSGAILSEQTYLKAIQTFKNSKILNVYGLSEAGPRVAAQRLCDNSKPGSVGKPINGVSVLIVDREGKILKEGEKGMVHVHTPCEFQSYINGYRKKSYYRDWLNTNDIGYLKDDNLYITGRADDMIVNGSHNVFPDDIEKVIMSFHDMKECLVFGIDDHLFGEKIICYLVLSKIIDDNITYMKELRKHCLKELIEYEVPKEFYIVKSLPFTNNGKVSRKIAKENYLMNKYPQ